MSDDGLFDLPGDDVRPVARPDSSGSLAGNAHSSAPLAVRMRPRTLDELVGHVLFEHVFEMDLRRFMRLSHCRASPSVPVVKASLVSG